MSLHCLDSSGWIEIFHNGPNAREFLVAMAEPGSVIISTISLYEVWKYTALHADERRAGQIVDLMRQSSVVAVDPEIAIHAAALSLKNKLPMADSIIYATSLANNATLWTQDSHFEGLTQVRYFPKIKL